MSAVGPYRDDGDVTGYPDVDGVFRLQGESKDAWIRCKNTVEVPNA